MKRLSERECGNLNQIRLMTTAYLCHGDRMLLMQRSAEREFLPSIWSGVGGHVETGDELYRTVGGATEPADREPYADRLRDWIARQ